MKATAIISVFLITQLSGNYQISAVLFKIRRTVQNDADSFEILSSLCPHNNDYECGHFSADAMSVTHNGCNCSCLTKEATFKLIETQWSCHENKDVRLNLQFQQQSRPSEKGTHKFSVNKSSTRYVGVTSYRPQNAFTLGTKDSWPVLYRLL